MLNHNSQKRTNIYVHTLERVETRRRDLYYAARDTLTGFKEIPRMKGMMDTTTLVSSEELIQWWVELAQDEQSPDYYELTEYGEIWGQVLI